MKKFILITCLWIISMIGAWAQENDTCAIRITKTEQGYVIAAASEGNVFVRKPNNGDSNCYVYVVSKRVELQVYDTNKIFLYNGNKIGKVEYQDGEYQDGEMKTDNDKSHALNPEGKNRRTWLVLNELNATTEVNFKVGDSESKQPIKLFQSKGWKSDNINSLKITLTIDGKPQDVSFSDPEKDMSYISKELKLPNDSSLIHIRIERPQNAWMQIDRLMIDDDTCSMNFTLKNTSSNGEYNSSEDDILYDAEVDADIKNLKGKKKLEIELECTALTTEGPKQLTLTIPVKVKIAQKGEGGEEGWTWWLWMIIGLAGLAGLTGLVLFLIKIIKKKWCRRKTKCIGKEKEHNEKEPEVKGPEPINREPQEQGQGPENGPTAPEPPTPPFIISDKEVARIIADVLNVKDGQKFDKDELRRRLRQYGARKAVDSWNSDHPDNQVPDSRRTLEGLFSTIDEGYIGKDGKEELKKSFTANELPFQPDETGIQNLHEIIYGKGIDNGAETIKKLKEELENVNKEVEQLKERNSTLDEDLKSLEKEKQGLIKEKESIQKRVKELEDNPQVIVKDPDPELKNQVENLNDQLKVKENENGILRNDLSVSNTQLNDANTTIKAKEDEIKTLTKNKSDWEERAKKAESSLKSIEKNHEEELKRLKEDHKSAILTQKDKYEIALGQKETELISQAQKHKEELEAEQKKNSAAQEHLRQKHDEEKKTLKSKYDTAIEEKEKQHNAKLKAEQEKHDTEVSSLQQTISELGIRANASREHLIVQVEDGISATQTLLDNMAEKANQSTDKSEIVLSTIKQMLSDFSRLKEKFAEAKNDEWKLAQTSIEKVRKDLQQLFKYSLRTSGWMNNMALLLSYSRIPDLCEQLEAKGIEIVTLEQINAQVTAMLGAVDMAIIIPAVLATKFSEKAHIYENDDVWIDKFFPNLARRNYAGKVFDIVRVGYLINGKEEKPIVIY